jgi:hypothetical protein
MPSKAPSVLKINEDIDKNPAPQIMGIKLPSIEPTNAAI